MKKNLLLNALFVFILGLAFTSCSDKDHDYWVNSSLDCTFLFTTDKNYYFGSTAVAEYRLSDLENIDLYREDVREIVLTDTWIEIEGDFLAGDRIDALEIYVEGIGTYKSPNDYVVVHDGDYFLIDESNSPGLFNFMADAMRKLNYSGKIYITCSGFHNVAKANIDVLLKSKLRVRVSD